MSLKIAFQMDEYVDVEKDLTAAFMLEAQNRGYFIYFFTPHQIAFFNNKPIANAFSAKITANQIELGIQKQVHLNDFDMIFIRQNPPFDMRYITTTYILDFLDKPLLINNPKGIRNYPEKILPLLFPEFIPQTLITEDLALIKKFHQQYGDIVLKPLYSYGGNDVLKLQEYSNIEVIVNLMIEKYKSPIIIQEYCSKIEDDKRVILLDGKPIGAMKRYVQSNKEIRTNLQYGSIPVATTLTDRDLEICNAIGPFLSKEGLIFSGIDIFNGYLLEINVTSPCGILQINQLYNINLIKVCWDCFESKLWKH